MKLCQFNIIKNIPFKPIIRVDGKEVTVTYRELWRMYGEADYVARVIGQALDFQPLIDRAGLMTILYCRVHYRLGYRRLCQVIRIVNNFQEEKKQ